MRLGGFLQLCILLFGELQIYPAPSIGDTVLHGLPTLQVGESSCPLGQFEHYPELIRPYFWSRPLTVHLNLNERQRLLVWWPWSSLREGGRPVVESGISSLQMHSLPN